MGRDLPNVNIMTYIFVDFKPLSMKWYGVKNPQDPVNIVYEWPLDGMYVGMQYLVLNWLKNLLYLNYLAHQYCHQSDKRVVIS